MHPDFVPSSSKHLTMSALEEVDRNRLKSKIEQMAIEQMRYYNVIIPSREGRLLSVLKSDTIMYELIFLEEKQAYKCKGYVLPDHPVTGALKRYKI